MDRTTRRPQAKGSAAAKAAGTAGLTTKARIPVSAKKNVPAGKAKKREKVMVAGMRGSAASKNLSSETMRAFSYAPQERIAIIREGIPARQVADLAARMGTPKDRLIDLLRISRATLNRRARAHKPLPQDESERVLGLATLIGQVETMLSESGAPEGFDVAKWLAQWLKQPLPALGGRPAAEYLDTVEGQKMISQLLATAQSGAYA